MKLHTKVKFINSQGKTVYGRIAEDDPKAKTVLVEDAIRPVAWELPRTVELTAIPSKTPRGFRGNKNYVPGDELEEYVADELEKAIRRSARNKKPDEGSLLRVAVGDGYAWYVVTKKNKDSCRYEWRGFSADNYMCPALGAEGSLPSARLEHLVYREIQPKKKKSK